MAFNPDAPTQVDLTKIVNSFAGPNTRKITDYLNGFQLGPQRGTAIIGAGGSVTVPDAQSDISYWTGDLLSDRDKNYANQVKAIRRSFTFRNILLEGLEVLADGIGADEADWTFTVTRSLQKDEKPTEAERALIAELEAIVTGWWDARDLPSLIQKAVINALAHKRQPVRPRIPDRFRDQQGRLMKREAERSLDPLWFVLPDVADAGIYADPDTLERYAITRVWLDDTGLKSRWEISSLNAAEQTVIRTVDDQNVVIPSTPLNLGGQLWLLELTMPRGMVTPDALSQQDARNVASTALNRNTRHAVFEKTIFVGLDPPLDEQGNPKPLSGPGSESWLSPMEMGEVEETGQVGAAGEPITITRSRLYPNANITKLDPAEPKAIQAAIDQATSDLYGILRQQFMLIAGDATASGRSRETSTGPYLRAVARCATSVEAFIRELLTFAMRISALVQGQPTKYDSLRPVVTLHQKIFEPSPDTLKAWLALWEKGIISTQTMRTMAGIADPDAEQQLIDRQQAPTV